MFGIGVTVAIVNAPICARAHVSTLPGTILGYGGVFIGICELSRRSFRRDGNGALGVTLLVTALLAIWVMIPIVYVAGMWLYPAWHLPIIEVPSIKRKSTD